MKQLKLSTPTIKCHLSSKHSKHLLFPSYEDHSLCCQSLMLLRNVFLSWLVREIRIWRCHSLISHYDFHKCIDFPVYSGLNFGWFTTFVQAELSRVWWFVWYLLQPLWWLFIFLSITIIRVQFINVRSVTCRDIGISFRRSVLEILNFLHIRAQLKATKLWQTARTCSKVHFYEYGHNLDV